MQTASLNTISPLVFLLVSLFALMLTARAEAMDLTLAWEPSTSPDVAGYEVWYKTGSSGPPYNGTGAMEGDSPVDVGNFTELTLHLLDEDKNYYFTVTAYDEEENDSRYSNEVSTAEGADSPDGSVGGSTGGGGGGSSWGCFVSSLRW